MRARTGRSGCASSPGVRVVAPGIRAGKDRREAVRVVVVRETAARAGEVRIERRVVRVDRMPVAACRVRLPDSTSWPRRGSVGAEHATRDDDPLAERLARVLARQDRRPCRAAGARRDGAGQLRERLRSRTSGSFGARVECRRSRRWRSGGSDAVSAASGCGGNTVISGCTAIIQVDVERGAGHGPHRSTVASPAAR